jgi:hypothetical protein
MSELYMDDIDRALAQEHARCHDRCPFEKEVKVVESERRQTFPRILSGHQALYDIEARQEALLSGIC